jgi:chemotaxis protein CheD
MNPLHSELPIIFLNPGELYISDQPAIVTTTLGSCVAVIFFNWRQHLGAICHALLPSGNGHGNRCKYLDHSFFLMLERFKLRGIKMEQIQVKLFGGADVLEYDRGACRPATVGQQNIAKALELVKAQGLNLQASNLGGTLGQKIFFYPHSGKVLVKRIEKVCWLGQKR